MNTIVNVSLITDYSGEPPILTYSNPVTTVIRQTPPARIVTRTFYCISSNCGNCFCGNCNNCGCNSSCC